MMGMLAFRYDPGSNRWTKVTPMTTRRLGVAVAVLNGMLYAVGGSDGASPLCTGSSFIFGAGHVPDNVSRFVLFSPPPPPPPMISCFHNCRSSRLRQSGHRNQLICNTASQADIDLL